MFNVWLPAVLESRAEGEGDQAIRSALKEFVLYSSELLHPRLVVPELNASRWMSRVDRRRMDDSDSIGTKEVFGYMYDCDGSFDVCVYQGLGRVGGGRQLDDHFGYCDGDVCGAL